MNYYSKYKADLFEFLKIESISPDSNKQIECEAAANWLVGFLQKNGISTAQILPGKKLPLVYAEISANGIDSELANNKPTLLYYAHYDVQPAPDDHLWDSDPFVPTERNETIYARGIADDKGQLMIFLAGLIESVESLKNESSETLNYNIELIIEGEEEIGSPHLQENLKTYKNLLNADVAMITDTSMYKDQPVILSGLKGMLMFGLKLTNFNNNLHSGMYGGAVKEPARELATITSKLVDNNGEILVPGIYDDVQGISEYDLESIEAAQNLSDSIESLTGAGSLTQNKNYKPEILAKIRPTLTINGIHSGTNLESASTIIPAEAELIFSIRLVADQEPSDIFEKVKLYIESLIPIGMKHEFTQIHGSYHPIKVDFEDTQLSNLVNHLEPISESIWGVKPIKDYVGGSIGVVADFREMLNIETLLFGFDLPTGNIHGKNENLPIEQFEKGVALIKQLL